jgi:hypothetical protein
MLKQQPRQTPFIAVFKLSTGEEIIATVKEETDTVYSLKNPLQMVMGQRGPQFAPWMMMADTNLTVDVKKASIVGETKPLAELEGQYESITTGIALPQKSSIVTA